jgi:hypothetical protein
MHTGPIRFPDWKIALRHARFSEPKRVAFEREIISFLRHCKAQRAAATVELATRYLAERERLTNAPAREALRWFYREGARRSGGTGSDFASSASPCAARAPETKANLAVDAQGVQAARVRRPMEPPPAASDLGSVPWERALIQAVRERGFLWRTEQTYRDWAVRFARFIAPRSPDAVGAEEVAAFLSALAVNGRASPSAQRQALNALVFFMLEALHRELGGMKFQRAEPKRRVPTVLSVAEARSLFAQMEGTPRLMVA